MGWEGQRAGGGPSLNAGRGSSECLCAVPSVQALPGDATLLPGFTPCVGPFTVPSLALPFLPSLSCSCSSLCMSVL